MDRPLADDPGERAVGRVNGDRASRNEPDIVSADGGKIEKAVVINIADLKSEFVAVAGEQDPGAGVGMDPGHAVAMDIGLDSIDERRGAIPPNGLGGLFVAGGTGTSQKGLKELKRVG